MIDRFYSKTPWAYFQNFAFLSFKRALIWDIPVLFEIPSPLDANLQRVARNHMKPD